MELMFLWYETQSKRKYKWFDGYFDSRGKMKCDKGTEKNEIEGDFTDHIQGKSFWVSKTWTRPKRWKRGSPAEKAF